MVTGRDWVGVRFQMTHSRRETNVGDIVPCKISTGVLKQYLEHTMVPTEYTHIIACKPENMTQEQGVISVDLTHHNYSEGF